MAELMGLKERQLGLASINSKLRDLIQVNAFLNAENPSGTYKLSFDKHKITLYCSDAEAVRSLVAAHKVRVVAEIRELAKRYEIELDAADEEVLA